jgi:uncharacterized protein (TIGR03067 family)
MWKYAILLAATLSLSFAPAPFPKPDPTKEDTKKLQGTWIKVRSFPPGNGEGEGRLEINGGRMRYSLQGTLAGEYSLSIDARKKPKLFTFKGTGGLADGFGYRGIYRLEGDQLTICYVMGDGLQRPTDFDTSKDGVILSAYKRQKP